MLWNHHPWRLVLLISKARTLLGLGKQQNLADILSFSQNLFGGMADTRDGFAEDIGFERDGWND